MDHYHLQVKIKKDNMKRIQYALSQDEEREILEEKKSSFSGYTSYVVSSFNRFKVGDCLILKESKFDQDAGRFVDRECQYENLSLTVRFLVVKEVINPYDSGDRTLYIKRLDEKGSFDPDYSIRPLFSYEEDINWNTFCKFDIDPLQIDSMLLGEEYNIEQTFSVFLSHKKHIVDIRKSNAKIFNDLDSLHAFLSQVRASGEHLYFHVNNEQEYEEEHVRRISLKHVFIFKNYKRFIKSPYGKYVVERVTARGINIEPRVGLEIIQLSGSRDMKWVTSLDLLNCALYTEEPASFKR